MRIYDGRDSFYQWDSNQKIVHNFKVGDEVHFFNMRQPTALTVRAYQLNDEVVADVPNILLQSSYPIYIYWMNLNDNGQFTKEEFTVNVNQRPKPSGYIYTETEVLSYEYLDARISEIEQNGVSSEQISIAVGDYLEKNPITGGASPEEVALIHQNKQDIEKLSTNKLDVDELPNAVNEALAQAKASGAFNGEPGDDYVLTEADKQEIAEQAAGMVKVPDVDIPTKLPNPNALTFTGAATGTYDGSAPLTVNIPKGGGGSGGETFTGQWEELVNHTVTADESTAVKLTFTQANYPKINGHKTLLVEIVKPSSVSTPWFGVSAGNTEVVNADAANWSCYRAVAAVHNGHWRQMSARGTNIYNADTIAPGYIFNSQTLGNRNKVYANYTSLAISSYTKFLEEGTTIKIYGGK